MSAQCPQSGIARHSGRRVYQPRLVGDQFMMSKDLERLHKELLEYDVVGHSDGGYDEGYSRCSCFWGKSPGSLVKRFLSENVIPQGLSVLDLGSGEGKNAFAFAEAGAFVVAVDCSALALTNGQREFAHPQIEWVLSDAAAYLRECGSFDVIIMYGLLHYLPSIAAIASVLELAKQEATAIISWPPSMMDHTIYPLIPALRRRSHHTTSIWRNTTAIELSRSQTSFSTRLTHTTRFHIFIA